MPIPGSLGDLGMRQGGSGMFGPRPRRQAPMQGQMQAPPMFDPRRIPYDMPPPQRLPQMPGGGYTGGQPWQVAPQPSGATPWAKGPQSIRGAFGYGMAPWLQGGFR